MVSEETYNQLYDAAERIYKYIEKDKGFYSGSIQDPRTRKYYRTYNQFKGSKSNLEKQLGRYLDPYELTILSLAVCYGPTPALTQKERDEAFATLWEGKGNPTRDCLTFDRLVTCI